MKYVCGDQHGELAWVKKAVEIAGDDPIIWLGDYCDSFYATVHTQLETISEIRKHDIKIFGNHDNHYLTDDRNFRGSGWNPEARPLLKKKLKTLDGIYCHVEDEYIITHAGIVDPLAEHYDIDDLNKMAEHLNSFFGNYDNSLAIYNVSPTRGGLDDIPGIFWCDWSELKDTKVFKKQIVGHSQWACLKEGYARHDDIWNIDSLQSKKPMMLKLKEGKEPEIVWL